MKRVHVGASGPGAIGSTIAAILFIVILGGWYLTWHHYRTQSKSNVSTACMSSNLGMSMGMTSGTAGTIYKDAVVTNHGSKSCTLTGYPAAFLLNTQGTILGTGAASNALYKPATITLTPEGKAHVTLGFPDAANFGADLCTTASKELELFLPGITLPVQTNWADQYCPGFSVTAIQSGS
jgi:hypothetical protein